MILACDDMDDGSGYLISEAHGAIRVLLWVKDQPVKGMLYRSYEYMHEQAVMHADSMLCDYSDLHRVTTIMYAAFLDKDRSSNRGAVTRVVTVP